MLKKFTASFLSMLFIISLFPQNVFAAQNKADDINDAIAFLESKQIILGEIKSVSKDEDSINFEIYSDILDITTLIKYTKNEEGVLLKVTEEDKHNELFYNCDGDLYIDGILASEANNNVKTIAQQYVYVSYTQDDLDNGRIPGQWGNTYVNARNSTIEKLLAGALANMTVTALAAQLSPIMVAYGIVLQDKGLEILCGEIIAAAAIYDKNTKLLYLDVVASQNNDHYPLQILYRYKIDFYFLGTVKKTWTGYTLATLI